MDDLEEFQTMVGSWAKQRNAKIKTELGSGNQAKLRTASTSLTDTIAEMVDIINPDSTDGVFALNMLVGIKNSLDLGIEKQEERLKSWLK